MLPTNMLQTELYLWIGLTIVVVALPLFRLITTFGGWILSLPTDIRDRLTHRTTTAPVASIIEDQSDSSLSPEPEEEIPVANDYDSMIAKQLHDSPLLLHETVVIADDTGVIIIDEEIVISDSTDSPRVDLVDTTPDNILSEKSRKQLDVVMFEAETMKTKGNIIGYEKKLVEGLAIEPQNRGLMKSLADHYMQQSEWKKSLNLYRKLIEHDPLDDKSIIASSQIYIELNDLPTAEYLALKATQLKPENPKYLMTLGEVYYYQKKLPETIDLVTQIIKLRPNNLEYLHTLARLHKENNDTDAYVYYLQHILILDANNTAIKQELAKYI